MESVSPMTTVPAGAPMRRAMRSPTWRGCVIQPAVFQPRMSCSPHSSVMTRAMRALAAIGSAPSELPSRYTTPSGMWNMARVLVKSVMARSTLHAVCCDDAPASGQRGSHGYDPFNAATAAQNKEYAEQNQGANANEVWPE